MKDKKKIENEDIQKGADSPTVHFINHESRISRLESTIDSINATLIRLEAKMDSGFTNINNKFDQISSRFERLENKMDSNLKWTLGVILTTTIALIGAIIHKG